MTLDPRRPVAHAIAVGGGRVLALGGRRELRHLAHAGTERVDCRGATVLPGLIDAHLHLFALAARRVNLDCSPYDDADTLLAAVRARATTLPPGAWVRGEGLDEARLGRVPTAPELERAAGGRPVRLRHRSRHASVLSTSALRLLGASGGTGVVAGREDDLARLVGPLSAAAVDDALAAVARELAALGLTTIADATPRTLRGLEPLRRVAAAGRFPLRVAAMRPVGTHAWAPVGRLFPAAMKVMVEETGGGLRPSATLLARRIRRAAASGGQVAVHCVGAATLVAALAAFAAVPPAERRGRRHRLEHVGECPPALVASIAALGLTVVTNPAFVRCRGDVYLEETTPAAHGWLYRAATLARAGIALAGASDAPVAPPSPWIGIAAARSRRTAAGAVLGGRERLGAAAALGLFTTGAARALRTDALGRLAAGRPGDLVVVAPDPLRASVDEVAAMEVRLTLVGGERAWPG